MKTPAGAADRGLVWEQSKLAGAVLQDNDDYDASLLSGITSHAIHGITRDCTSQGIAQSGTAARLCDLTDQEAAEYLSVAVDATRSFRGHELAIDPTHVCGRTLSGAPMPSKPLKQ